MHSNVLYSAIRLNNSLTRSLSQLYHELLFKVAL